MEKKLVLQKSILTAALYSSLPWFQCLYVYPFIPLYPAWFSLWLFYFDDYFGSVEVATLTFVLLFFSHLLSYLACEWSVVVKTWMTCTKVKFNHNSSNQASFSLSGF
jgi:hypothetical protein